MVAAVAVAVAPVRVADCGGWTDTWFARSGAVCNVAVEPGVTVRTERVSAAALARLVVDGAPAGWDDHPLLAAAVRSVPDVGPVAVEVGSAVPAGSGLGTSAAVTVALVAALDALAGRQRPAVDLARDAHRIETVDCGLQSGVQDQLAAALGGPLDIQVPTYPEAEASKIPVPAGAWAELSERLVTVYLGRPHRSSEVHELVIGELERNPSRRERLEPLRQGARRAATALAAGDLGGYGAALTACTEGIAALHPALVSDDALRVMAVARLQRALGWKVNGAGGEGGSVTVLCGPDPEAFRGAVTRLGYHVVDVHPSDTGVRLL
jgi:D-glycero-alpha-D-manno-heptose-7-phosphate kinase